ncbi:GntR family transcriptional regulator [Clostridium gasigenes]|uniref:GntR family transcriptional regulator n=1 Tax=Clostridium gasigenes TaxID=94869 RepID=A0A1H0SH06_9CLOT|nr:GntR family transcriptional regulator [Clostridium gasigenes]MBB6625031.1 GntR family transcriptional regulator [Clostridium gasigenes]MBB6715494.1 GntR family transcriptional regulator [Clostridium gasigenes]MBU3088945.1 GntR family transcriptional regulator [Clostridium gasigenes]MBU3108688.1 GntR family transcriptional regulator [Clostridium gasigenes]MBU3133441.1 GntR family transcriptional regulator [Clostridium gasigenes]
MIDKSSPIPVYYQLKNDLIIKISQGIWKPGECIASERELCEIYGVSRMTIRQALGELVQEDVLFKIKGKGTFVCEPTVKQEDMMSFTDMMKQTGRNLKTEVIEFNKINTPEHLTEIISLDKVYIINRKRIVDNECIAVEKVYIPVDYCGYIDEKMLEGSLFKILEEFGYMVDHSQSSIAAVIMNSELKDLFKVSEAVPLLKMTSKTYTQKGKMIFLEESIYRSDKFVLQVNISMREGKIK